jgi:hypothetical protein
MGIGISCKGGFMTRSKSVQPLEFRISLRQIAYKSVLLMPNDIILVGITVSFTDNLLPNFYISFLGNLGINSNVEE